MASHIIITCGTSQLDRHKLTGSDSLGLNLHAIGFEELSCQFNLREETNEGISWLRNQEVECTLQSISQALCNILQTTNAMDWIGRQQNPIGAELSTLMVLFQEATRYQTAAANSTEEMIENPHSVFFQDERIRPTNNRFHLICSHTFAGMFSAGVIKAVVECVEWGTATVIPVPGLCENPKHPELALQHFAEKIIETLSNTGKEDEHPDMPVFLAITGGFKSVIPCATVASLVYCIPMIYLFEESSKLQILATYPHTSGMERWIAYWNNLAKMGIVQVIPWFQAVLDFREKFPSKIWY